MLRMMHPSSKCSGHLQQGAAAVEFAFVIFILLLIIAGTIGFGRAFWYADALTKATRDGARLISTWPKNTIYNAGVVGGGVAAARDITINNANAAKVNPPLVAGNVVVECLNSTFSVVACVDGTAPENVRVSISGFNVDLGKWFPFIGLNLGSVGMSPHTTMRYMNGS